MKLSFTKKMIISMLIIIVIPIITLGVLTYQQSKNVLIEDLKTNNNNILFSTEYYINKYISEEENSIKFWVSDPYIASYFSNPAVEEHIKSEWKKFINHNKDIRRLYFGSKDGKFAIKPDMVIPKEYDPRQGDWYKRAVKSNGDTIWSEPYFDQMSGEMMVTVSCLVRDETNKKIIGVIGVDYNLRNVSEDLYNNGWKGFEQADKFIIDNKGEIIVNSDYSKIGKDISSNSWVKSILINNSGSTIIKTKAEKLLINYITINKTGWKLISILPMKVVQSVVIPIRNRTLVIAVLSGLIACLAGLYLSKRTSDRIKSIINFMEEVEKGNNEVLGFYDGDDMFGELNRKFNALAININLKMNEIKHIAYTDGLTGLYNHRYIYQKLEEEINRLRRYKAELSIIMIDVDFFKSINDTYGHQVGDQALILVASSIKNNIREIDIVGRYGGEEFLVIMPGCSGKECYMAAERIRKNIEEIKWDYKERKLTISLGIKQFAGEDTVSLIDAADKLLYKAKELGRNRIEI